jgi:hypothetical protein
VPRRQSLSSPIGTSEIEWGEPEVQLKWTRDRKITNLDTGLTIEQHDEIFVKGPPDAAIHAAELAEQGTRDSFRSAYLLDQPYETPALDPPDPTPEIPLILAPDQYEELPEGPPQHYRDWLQDDEDNLHWQQDDRDNLPPSW